MGALGISINDVETSVTRKNCQMSNKSDVTRKMIDFNTFTKIGQITWAIWTN